MSTVFSQMGNVVATEVAKKANTEAPVLTGLVDMTGSATTLATKLINAKEVMTTSAIAATGTINFDITTQSAVYYTSSATANFALNFRGNSVATLNSMMDIGECVTTTFLNTCGGTAYYNTSILVDGITTTVNWQGGTAPTSGNASSIDVYTYTIIKTAETTFTVLGSQVQFA